MLEKDANMAKTIHDYSIVSNPISACSHLTYSLLIDVQLYIILIDNVTMPASIFNYIQYTIFYTHRLQERIGTQSICYIHNPAVNIITDE